MRRNYVLPEGTVEVAFNSSKTQSSLINEETGLYVTIDWEMRSYAFGGRNPKNSPYGQTSVRGRGWQQKLVDTAIQAATKNK